MDEETLNNYKKAGKIAAEALNYGASLIKPDVLMIEVVQKIEQKITELGGKMAFPAQVSCNDIAAHFCPDLDEEAVFKDQVVCLDVGVHVEGCIGDNATTVDLSGNNEELVKASREALNNAIKIITPGVTLGEIGKTIQETISSFNFAPVRNLSGHGLDTFNIHTYPTIPNFDTKDTTELKDDQVIAIEPFASKGAGIIYESGNPGVFQLIQRKPVRNPIVRNILNELNNYDNLPFAKWWLQKKFGAGRTNLALRELERLESVKGYPPLVDKAHGLVSQAEHSLIVKDKPIILTKNE